MIPPAVDDAIDLTRVHRALVIKLRHHGDVLLASPVFTVLKRAAPHADIDALIYTETAPMLARHPFIDVVHTIDRDRKSRTAAGFADEWQLWRALRARHYDLVVHLTDHPRGAWLARLLHASLPDAAIDAAAHGRDESRRAATHRYLARRRRQGARFRAGCGRRGARERAPRDPRAFPPPLR